MARGLPPPPPLRSCSSRPPTPYGAGAVATMIATTVAALKASQK
jgi:hypothetical protein